MVLNIINNITSNEFRVCLFPEKYIRLLHRVPHLARTDFRSNPHRQRKVWRRTVGISCPPNSAYTAGRRSRIPQICSWILVLSDIVPGTADARRPLVSSDRQNQRFRIQWPSRMSIASDIWGLQVKKTISEQWHGAKRCRCIYSIEESQ